MNAPVNINVEVAGRQELTKFYNEHAVKPVVKFKSTEYARERVKALLKEMAENEVPPPVQKGRAPWWGGGEKPADAPPEGPNAGEAPEAGESQDQIAPPKERAAAQKSTVAKPWQAAKKIVVEAVQNGVTVRKEIIKLCQDAGISYNTADAAHYELVVKPAKEAAKKAAAEQK